MKEEPSTSPSLSQSPAFGDGKGQVHGKIPDAVLLAQMNCIWTDLGQMREQTWKPLTAYSIVLGILGFSFGGSSNAGNAKGIFWLVGLVSAATLTVIGYYGWTIARKHHIRMTEKMKLLTEVEEALKAMKGKYSGHLNVGPTIASMYSFLAWFGAFLVLVFIVLTVGWAFSYIKVDLR